MIRRVVKILNAYKVSHGVPPLAQVELDCGHTMTLAPGPAGIGAGDPLRCRCCE